MGVNESSYVIFDKVMQWFGLPVLYLLLLIVAMMHPTDYSLFTIILKESYILRLFGECSLAIYLFHWIIIEFYFPLAICGIQQNQNPYTRL